MRVLWRSPGRGDVNPSFGTVLPGLWSPLSNYLVSFFTPDWSLHPPQDVGTTFAKIDPPQRPVGACPHLLWDGAPTLFDPQEALSHMFREGSLSLTSDGAPYLFALAEPSVCHLISPWSLWVRTELEFYSP